MSLVEGHLGAWKLGEGLDGETDGNMWISGSGNEDERGLALRLNKGKVFSLKRKMDLTIDIYSDDNNEIFNTPIKMS